MIALDPAPQPEIRSRVVASMIALDPLPDVLFIWLSCRLLAAVACSSTSVVSIGAVARPAHY